MSLYSRRSALARGTLAVASLALPTLLPPQAIAQSLAARTGLQLISVEKELLADMSGTLARIAAIGYRSVESAGLSGRSARDFRKALDDAGLRCPSSHFFLFPGMSAEQYFEDVRTLGSEYLVSSILIDPAAKVGSGADFVRYAATRTQDDYKRMGDGLNRLARQIAGFGLKLAYHNHNMEFRRWPDGSTSFDTLMSGTDPALVTLEVDCGLAELGGRTPTAIFNQYPGRVRMLHVKDFVAPPRPIIAMDQTSSVQWTVLGRGHMDYRAILAAAPKAGVEQIFVEEGALGSSAALDVAEANFKYLQSIA